MATATIAAVGLAAGLHGALYGAHKDSPHESFLLRRFVREVAIALTVALLRLILGIGFLSSIYGIYALGAVIPEDWPVEARGLVIGLSIGIAEAIAGAYKDGSKLFKTLVRDYVPGKFMSLTGPYLQWAARRRYFVVPYAVTWLLYGCRGNRHGPARRRPTCRRSLARATPATAAIRLAVVFLSALVGFPPFFVVSLAAGALGVEFRRFFAAGAIGRLVHFTVVACIPELLRRAF